MSAPYSFDFMKSLFIALFAFSSISLVGAEHVQIRRGVPNFLAKVESAGKPVHVAFLGGSITQNAKGHTAMVPAWLQEKYPKTEFVFTNAGLSSTCSTSGAFRLRTDVLEKGPVDLLIVEFAVNDDQDAMHSLKYAQRGLEGIVRQFQKLNPDGDIIQVHFVNPGMLEAFQKDGVPVSVQAHEAVAKHYHLTSVNVGSALAEKVTAGEKTWKENYGGTHPNQEGYQFASDLISSAIAASPKDGAGARELPEPLDPASYENGRFVDPQEASWLGGWDWTPVSKESLPVGSIRGDYEKFHVLRGDEPGEMLYMSFQGSVLGAFILAGPDAGTLEVSIDNGEWKTVETYHKHSKGLNYPRSVILADGLSSAYHQAVIRISEKKHADSKGHAVNILMFEVN